MAHSSLCRVSILFDAAIELPRCGRELAAQQDGFVFWGYIGSAHEEHLIPKARWENTEARGKSVALGALADNEKYKPATSLPGAHEKQDLVGAGHSET
jgi:hypothetical protein